MKGISSTCTIWRGDQWRRFAWGAQYCAAVLTVALAAFCVFMRLQLPDSSLDGDYQTFLNYAIKTHMVFGRDIAFTYGPTAFLEFPIFDPALHPWKVAGLSALSLLTGVLWTHTVVRAGLAPLWAAAALGLGLLSDFGPAAYAFMAVVCIWVFCRGERLTLPSLAAVMVVLVAFAFTKFTMFIMACGLVALMSLDGFLERDWRLATALPVFLGASALAWALWFGDLSSAVVYVSRSWALSQGHNNAMQWPGPTSEVVLYALGASALVILVTLRGPTRRRRAIHALSLAFVLFVLHKHAFVRHDAHALMASRALFFTVTLYALLSWRRAGARIRFSFLALWVFAVYSLSCSENFHTNRSIMEAARQTSTRARDTAMATLSIARGTFQLASAYDDAMAHLRIAMPLPAVSGSVDIYPLGQTLLVAHRLAVSPRPVFQSYVAYSEELLRINSAHLAEQTPEWLLWQLSATDGRLLAQDESLSWLEVLRRYDFVRVRTIGEHLLLHRRSTPLALERTKLAHVDGNIDADIALPPTEGLVWVRISVRPSFWGRLRGLLYKPAGITLELRTEEGARHWGRFIPEMGRAGFLAAPLVTENAMFGELVRMRGKVGALGGRSQAVRLIPDPGSIAMFERKVTIDLELVTVN